MALEQHLLQSYTKSAAISKDDNADLPTVARAIYIGGTGDLKVTTVGGSTVTFAAVPVGVFDCVHVKKVFSTGTTATNMIALYN